MQSLVQLLAVTDPHARLVATLERLDETITAARNRVRVWSGCTYADPDTNAVGKLEEYAQGLVREYHAARASSVADIGALDRAAAIAELRAVLAVWEDPSVSDAQWLASRGVGTPAATVVRRKRAGSRTP